MDENCDDQLNILVLGINQKAFFVIINAMLKVKRKMYWQGQTELYEFLRYYFQQLDIIYCNIPWKVGDTLIQVFNYILIWKRNQLHTNLFLWLHSF